MSLPAAELERLREAYEATLHDAGQIARPVAAQDAAGQEIADAIDWPSVPSVPCGVGSPDARLYHRAADQTPILAAALVRLPHGTDARAGDAFRITHRYGSELAEPPVYEVLSEPIAGLAGVVVAVAGSTP